MAPQGAAPFLAAHARGTVVSLRLQPRARRTGILGMVGDRLKIGVSGPPVEGKANEELCRYLSGIAGVPKSAVVILRGETAREKTVLVRGVRPAVLAERLAAADAATRA